MSSEVIIAYSGINFSLHHKIISAIKLLSFSSIIEDMAESVQIEPGMIGFNSTSGEGIEFTESLRPGAFILLKEYFGRENSILSPEDMIKSASQFNRFALPGKFNEYFLEAEHAPFYWICELPVNIYVKDFYRHHFPGINGTDQYTLIRDNYLKWLLIKTDSEKKYFAATVINSVEKSGLRNNFFGLILYGVVLAYDNTLFNPAKASVLFDQAKNILDSIKINKDIKNSLNYMIEYFAGIAQLKCGNRHEAKERFLNALSINPAGITAKYTLAFTEASSGNLDVCEYLLKELFEAEAERMAYAISSGNLRLVKYLINHSLMPAVSRQKEFLPFVQSLVEQCVKTKESSVQTVDRMRNELKSIIDYERIKDYPELSYSKLIFLDKVIELAGKTGNIYLYSNVDLIKREYADSIELIISNIRNKYFGSISEKLLPFEKEIAENSAIVERITTEIEEKKSVLRKNISSFINSLEQQKEEKILAKREKITHLEEMVKYNPHVIFRQTMGYNIILTIVVMFMGGCSGYSGISINNIMQLRELLSSTLLTALKWGIIVFLAGILISAAAAIFSLLERAGIKQKLLKQISDLKNDTERTVNRFKKEAEKQELKMIEDLTAEISRAKSVMGILTKKKEKEEEELKQEAEENYREEASVFETLIY